MNYNIKCKNELNTPIKEQRLAELKKKKRLKKSPRFIREIRFRLKDINRSNVE